MDEVLCSFIYSYIQCPLYNHNWTLVKLCVCYPNKHYKYLQYSRKIATCEIVKIINNHENDNSNDCNPGNDNNNHYNLDGHTKVLCAAAAGVDTWRRRFETFSI